MQRSRRGFQAEKEYEERHEDQNGWGACRNRPRAPRGEEMAGHQVQGLQKGGGEGWEEGRQGGGACKAMLRSLDFILQAMTRILKILQLMDDLLKLV